MPRKHLTTDFDLVLQIENRPSKLTGMPREDNDRVVANEIKRLIERHVVPHSPVPFSLTLKAERDYRCEFCNSHWTEQSETYNGGCCARDEENNPDARNEHVAEPLRSNVNSVL